MTSTHEHLEHAEHNQHHAANPFDKRVAVTMAIIAALLAAVTMLGHRTHNATLYYQGEANRYQALANIAHTQETDAHTKENDFWAYYQAKNVRNHLYQTFYKVIPVMSVPEAKKADADKLLVDLKNRFDDYEKVELPDLKKKAESYAEKAAEYAKKAEACQAKSMAYMKKSQAVHRQADWFDSAELAVEIGLVLCSIAVLTKLRPFWIIGILAGIVGLVLVAVGWFVPDILVGASASVSEGY
jgi:hypothetical protein